MKILAIGLMLCASLCSAADLASGTYVLLQPDEELQKKELNVQDFASSAKAAESAATNTLKPLKLGRSTGFIVFAVREGKRSNAWLDLKPALPAAVEAKVIASIRSIPPFHVANGTVVFALKIMINGAPETDEQSPFPAAWRTVMASNKEPVEAEALVKLIWP